VLKTCNIDETSCHAARVNKWIVTLAMSTICGAFINITGEPSRSRNARRIQVRRTVMTNYHKRRSEKKKPASREDTTATNQSTQSTPPSQESSSTNTHSVEILPYPPAACNLLKPKPWADLHRAQTSNAITHFLRGQVQKAAQDLSCVCFIHHRIREACDQPQNSLVACQELFRAHHDSETSQRQVGVWEDISIAQENIYEKVRFLLLIYKHPC
jgi:hypothetical protein